jgi:hypothetical protein
MTMPQIEAFSKSIVEGGEEVPEALSSATCSQRARESKEDE